jgi:1-acyl-sn-glycerol-3-phosphate acyltransferase
MWASSLVMWLMFRYSHHGTLRGRAGAEGICSNSPCEAVDAQRIMKPSLCDRIAISGAPDNSGQSSEDHRPMLYLLLRPAIQRALRLLFFALGGVRVEGMKDVPRRGRLIVTPNHLSHADPPLVGAYLPRAAWYAAAEELFDYRFAGRFSRFVRAMPIRQDSADRAALRRFEHLLAREEAVVLFPEGHESQRGDLHALQGGTILLAVRTGAPVLPVGIIGTDRMLAPREFKMHRSSVPAILRFGKPIPVEVLTGGLKGRAAINHGLSVLGEAIRELSGQEWAEGVAAVAAVANGGTDDSGG